MTAEAILVRGPHDVRDVAGATIAGLEIQQMNDGRAGVRTGNCSAASGDPVAFVTEGQFTVPKTANEVWLDGCELWWDHSANAATAVPRLGAGDKDFFLGCCVGDVAAATTSGLVNLNVRPQYIIDLARDPFQTTIIKTVVGSTTVEVPHVEPRGGGVAMILGTTAEAQKIDLISERSFAPGAKWILEAEINIITNSDNAAGDFNVGVASASHDTDADAIAESAFFHTNGNDLNLYAECDDGTNETAATDTTSDFVAGTPVHLVIDGRDLADLHYYVNCVEKLAATTFLVSAMAGPLKALAHLEKTADDSPGTYVINRLRVRTAERA